MIKIFVKYIARKPEGYEEGIDILPENLMHPAVQKFKLLKKTNKGNAPSESEEKIISLQSEVEDFKKNAKSPKVNRTEKYTESKKGVKDQ